MRDLEALKDLLRYRFRDETLLNLALTHSSTSRTSTHPQAHNQRLEFLGDAVLQLVLSSELYRRFPDIDEGSLTKTRAKLVNQQHLAAQGKNLSLGALVRMSRGEETTGGRTRASLLADAFEAVLGAVYLDGGYDAARDVIQRLYKDTFDELGGLKRPPGVENPKGELQEFLQAASPEAPEYRVLSTTGPDHDRLFECSVFHRGVELGRGSGRSKKVAESMAALVALANLRKGKGA